jgi:hypothetical protein
MLERVCHLTRTVGLSPRLQITASVPVISPAVGQVPAGGRC